MYLGTWGLHPKSKDRIACIWQKKEDGKYKLIKSTMPRVDNEIVWETYTGNNTKNLSYLKIYYSWVEANTIEEVQPKCVEGLRKLQPESRGVSANTTTRDTGESKDRLRL